MLQKNRFIGLCALVLVSIFIPAAASYTNTENPRTKAEQMEQSQIWAQIDASSNPADDHILIKGKNICVYQDEVDRIAQKYAAGGIENGEELAISYILRREALYHAGIEEGFAVTETEIQAMIQQNEEMAQGAMGREYFDEYLKTAGMTEHEYWVSQAEQFKKEIVIEKYLSYIKVQNNLSPVEWESFKKKLVSDLLRAEGINR